MKTIIASFALAFAAVTGSFATDNANVANPDKMALQTAVYPSADTHKINVVVGKTSGVNASIKLLSTEGEILYIQHLGKKQTVTHSRFDLSELKDGVYVVEISNGYNKEVKKVSLQTPEQKVERVITMK